MLQLLREYIWVFIVSMTPIVELRGAIPIGVGMGLDLVPTYIVAIIGNCLPVPIIMLFAKKVLDWFCTFDNKLSVFAKKIIAKATEKAETLGTYELWGLFLFVAIPLPGTGAWTGSLIATILGLRVRKAFPVVCLGVMTAGVIMSLASAGVFGALGYLFSV